jgi:hypothetical protein
MNSTQQTESELAVDELKNDAIQRLNRDPNIAGEYRVFLERHSQGLCDQCGQNMGVVVKEPAGEDTVRYKFACGHGHIAITRHEKVCMRESVKGYVVPEGKGKCNFVQEFFHGWSPSDSPDLPEGVNIESNIDKKNNKYKKKVIDVKTGEILKDQEESLTEHQGYGSAKFKTK